MSGSRPGDRVVLVGDWSSTRVSRALEVVARGRARVAMLAVLLLLGAAGCGASPQQVRVDEVKAVVRRYAMAVVARDSLAICAFSSDDTNPPAHRRCMRAEQRRGALTAEARAYWERLSKKPPEPQVSPTLPCQADVPLWHDYTLVLFRTAIGWRAVGVLGGDAGNDPAMAAIAEPVCRNGIAYRAS